MQTDLRLLLLIIGAVLGALIIYKAFREKKEKAPPLVRHQFEKSVIENAHRTMPHKNTPDVQLAESDPLLEDYEFTHVEIEGAPISTSEIINQELPQEKVPMAHKPVPEVIALTILPRDYYAFSGETLLGILQQRQYQFGKMKIFHRHDQNDPEKKILFSLASLVEPGVFDYNKIPFESYRGLALWMVYSDKEDSMLFEAMLEEARELAEILNGTVCDDKRQQLTVQAISNIRLKMRETLAS